MTIRMFRRNPWTITDFIENNTVSTEVAALMWLAIQYEMSMIISGGTASGKTSFLGSVMPFIQPNQRVISIEDTRELNLPKFLHWVPMTTREPNPEGKGKIEMLDLLVNSLRMRPDRIIVAEIRHKRQAEVLFEAMHTGHSVYATLHADTVEQTYRRLINPPINVPETLLEALDIIVAMFRDRRSGIRRIYQVAELIPPAGAKQNLTMRVLFKWNARKDKIERFQNSYRLMNKLEMHTGMSLAEIEKDIKEKEMILNWMVKNGVKTVDGVGKLVAEYYKDPQTVLNIVKKNENADKIIPKNLLEG
jgi:flagellar protein FlaI